MFVKKLLRQPKKFFKKWYNLVHKNELFFENPNLLLNQPNLILVVGAESTATRFVSKILAIHDSIEGEKFPEKHYDFLDDVWKSIEYNSEEKTLELFPEPKENSILLTRRSIPHSLEPDSAAVYGEFPPIESFLKLAQRKGFVPVVLVTTRSPLPNIMSWKQQRSSSEGSFKKTLQQYQWVYPYIFSAISSTRSTYYILSQEAMLLEGYDYIKSIFYLLGLEAPIEKDLPDIKTGVNEKYYQEYEQRFQSQQ